ncbi:hypothetical protein [Rhodohalobacter sp. 8-1]|uniref:hypothetical protein n=1 Tax=Rhodohalobacter sp. 8-1 TaxID=3131972 RepID=UPI0030EF0AD2
MNADNYPPINVLSVFRGVPSQNIPYQITPYRFETQNGSSYQIKEIRQFHSDRRGKGRHFHYIVVADDDRTYRILFDTNTFSWRLVDRTANEQAIANG